MLLIEKAFFLKKTALFSELDLDLVLAIADKAEERLCSDEELIFAINQDAHRLYAIVHGKVAIVDASDTVVAELEAQDFFGDEALFSQKNRGYTATAKGEAHLISITRTHLIEIMLECPQVAISLIRAYAKVTPFRGRNGA